MTKLFKMARRNVWRNRRRTLITMGAVLFSVLIITLTRSLQYGTYDAIESYAARLFTGDVQVQRAGYQEEQTLAYALKEDEQDWHAMLAAEPWVEAYTRRLTGFALISSDSSSAGAMVVGVDTTEHRVSSFIHKFASGTNLAPDDDHRILLGQTLASNLSASVGDTVVALTQGYRNEMGADLYVVKGILDSGNADVDRGMVVMSLSDAQALFLMLGRFTQLVLRSDDFRRDGHYAAALLGRLNDDRYAVLGWDTLMPELRQMIVLDNASGAIFLAFMLILIGFEIFNATMMSVMDRVREFGIMQAMGMKPYQLALLVWMELTIKIVLALALSMAVCGGLLAYLSGHPIPMSESMIDMYKEFGFSIDALVFSGRAQVFLEPLISVALIAALATVYPVVRVWHFAPMAALLEA